MSKKIYWIILPVIGVLCAVVGYYIRKAVEQPIEVSTWADTVYLTRTVEVPIGYPVTVKPAEPISIDSSEIVPSVDSSRIMIKADVHTYTDTLNGIRYQAVVSGIHPALEYLQLSYPERTITQQTTVIKPYRGWKMSAVSTNVLSGDFSLAKFQSFTGLEFSYNTGPFAFGLQGGLQVEKPLSKTSQNTSFLPYAGARIEIDILKFK